MHDCREHRHIVKHRWQHLRGFLEWYNEGMCILQSRHKFLPRIFHLSARDYQSQDRSYHSLCSSHTLLPRGSLQASHTLYPLCHKQDRSSLCSIRKCEWQDGRFHQLHFHSLRWTRRPSHLMAGYHSMFLNILHRRHRHLPLQASRHHVLHSRSRHRSICQSEQLKSHSRNRIGLCIHYHRRTDLPYRHHVFHSSLLHRYIRLLWFMSGPAHYFLPQCHLQVTSNNCTRIHCCTCRIHQDIHHSHNRCHSCMSRLHVHSLHRSRQSRYLHSDPWNNRGIANCCNRHTGCWCINPCHCIPHPLYNNHHPTQQNRYQQCFLTHRGVYTKMGWKVKRADCCVVAIIIKDHSSTAVTAPKPFIAAARSFSNMNTERRQDKHWPESESATSRDISRSAAGIPHWTFFVPVCKWFGISTFLAPHYSSIWEYESLEDYYYYFHENAIKMAILCFLDIWSEDGGNRIQFDRWNPHSS